MGADAHVLVVGGEPGLAARARERIGHLERLWSRFDPDSELSRLNRCAGTFVPASVETLLLLERAHDGWALSAGAFDATMLDAVIAAGYDRTFDELVALERGAGDLAPQHAFAALGSDEPPFERRDGTVCIRPGSAVDSGGIGKGLAADLVVAELREGGADGACVNLGGDLRVSGESPTGGGWTIGVDHAWSSAPIALVGIGEGAMATSTTLRRRWLVEGEWCHHLIDPRSGLPSDSDLNHATVIAGKAWVAEVLAKAVLLNGAEFAFNLLGGTGAEALAVDQWGAVMATPGFTAYLGDGVVPASIQAPGAVGLSVS
jgi:thiamine biosynthesis lipoprotein